ncbi:MAG: alpha/beta fold hydrolase [Nannocystaceae bacterium]
MTPPGVAIASRLVQLERGRMFVGDYLPRGGEGGRLPLLLVHGFGSTGHTWANVVWGLCARRRVVVPDLLGCGGSDRPRPMDKEDYGWAWAARNLHELLWRLEIPRIVVVGHGFGGAVVAGLAARASAGVLGIVLVGALCPAWKRPWRLKILGSKVLGGVCAHAIRRRDVERFLRRGRLIPEIGDPDGVDLLWDQLHRRGGRDATLAVLRSMARPDAALGRLYARMTGPTRVVWGDRDRQIPSAVGRALAQTIVGGSFEIVEGCGHAPQEERPGPFGALLERFADDIDAAAMPGPGQSSAVGVTAPVPPSHRRPRRFESG